MINLSNISIGRLSSGVTAFVCAGFLVNAIMTDNGGQPDSQERWREAQGNAYSFVERLRQHDRDDWYSGWDGVDETQTGSIGKLTKQLEQKTSKKTVEEPSVLSLIRENSDVVPGVSRNGTGRVSVLVKEGDTLFGIARKHGLNVTELARLNGLKEPYVIRVGQNLFVAR